MANIGNIHDTFMVTLELHASYTLQIPAEDEETAVQTAYQRAVIADKLYVIDKDVKKVVRMREEPGKLRFIPEFERESPRPRRRRTE